MCGRVIAKSPAEVLVALFGVERRQGDMPEPLPRRYNGAPGLEYPLIIREPDMPGSTFMMAKWGFVPAWWTPDKGLPRRPVNAMAETVATNGMFRGAYRSHRALMPVDGYFEWKAIKEKVKQPYAIALTHGRPFALAAIWDRYRDAGGVEWKTFCVITCAANELMSRIHDRMPVILAPEDYDRWLGEEPDPRELLRPFPSVHMTMWPVSTRVNSVANDDPSLIDPIEPEDGEPEA
ncbi:SOS response-associated peptidase [Aquabacter sp. CN5-332]|uniref:SOS response-associated peptidase n=1 Tax=Aquabacter sp. CN5-332 TaxID=3156608 RepID=UPI0032B4F75C